MMLERILILYVILYYLEFIDQKYFEGKKSFQLITYQEV
ncbi:hypothetical protein pb186bvf_018010 [Paramecium bursaria]